jgi:hypothetical protein
MGAGFSVLGEGDLESTQSSPLPVMAPWLRCGDTPLRICNFGEIDHSPSLLSLQTPHKIPRGEIPRGEGKQLSNQYEQLFTHLWLI